MPAKIEWEEYERRIREIHGDKILSIKKPDNFTGSRSKPKITCINSHEFSSTIYNLVASTNPTFCKECVNIPWEEYESRIREIHGEKIFSLEKPENYTGCKSKPKITCINHHEFIPSIASLVGKKPYFCPECSPNRKKTWEYYEEIIKSIHGDKIVSIEKPENFSGNTSRPKIVCINGHEFDTIIASLVSTKPSFCPECSPSRKKTWEYYEEQIKSIHGDKILSMEKRLLWK